MQWDYTQVEQNEFEQEYRKINDSYKGELIFKFGDDSGFFSEFLGVISALVYCYDNKIKFTLTDGNANFSPKNGMAEFFHPFYRINRSYFAYNVNSRHKPRKFFKEAVPWFTLKFLFSKLVCGAKYFTQDVFNDVFHKNFTDIAIFDFLKIKDEEDFKNKKKYFLFLNMLWKLNEKTLKYEEDILSKLSLKGFNRDSFVSMQIRKGDKFEIEKQRTVSWKLYIEKLRELTNIRDVLLLCDDLDIFLEMKESAKDFNFYTICEPQKNGYVNSIHSALEYEELIDKTRRLIVTLDLFMKSKLFLGTRIANPYFFMKVASFGSDCKKVLAIENLVDNLIYS